MILKTHRFTHIKSYFCKPLFSALGSVPGLTVIFLLLIELTLRLGNPIDVLGYHTVDLWNLPPRFDLCRKTNPDVALIGSSLVLALNLEEGESFTFSRLFPPYLQTQLRNSTQKNITCINLATGSQMVSEGYMIVKVITSQENHPRVVFYGVALRDFMNDALRNEWTTDSFLSICPFAPVDSDTLDLMSSDEARKEFVLSHLFYLYRNHVDFKNVLSALAKNFLENLPLDQSFYRTGDDRDYTPRKQGWLWEEWIPRKHIASQFKANPKIMQGFVFAEHLPVYRLGSELTRQIESRYLEGLAKLCHDKKVTLVIINMPLSQQLMNIAPPGLNDAFKDYLSSFCQKYNLPYLDFLGEAHFTSSLFSDGAHLNCAGAQKLSNEVIEKLKERYPQVLLDIAQHADQRAQNPQLKEKQESPYNQPSILP